MLQFDIVTLFPDAFNFEYSIVGRAINQKLVHYQLHDLRNFGKGIRRNVDDTPFGGGPGMVMTVEPLYQCLKQIGAYPLNPTKQRVLVTAANGTPLTQARLQEWSQLEKVTIICGHYEGIDQRIIDNMADETVSIGNYVLSGGEIPAQVIVDGITRLIPGALGNPASLAEESFTAAADIDTEYPQYSRPAVFTTEEGNEWKVPDVLLSGHHAEIEKWRKLQSKK